MTPQELTGQTTSHLTPLNISGQVLQVHSKVVNDLSALITAANKAGFNLQVASGFRDYRRQQLIWNRKFSGDTPILDSNSQPLVSEILSDEEKAIAILRWSALPGASRHHWGTDFDLFAENLLPPGEKLRLEPDEYLQGHQAPFYHWLRQHLNRFGFFFPYARDLGGVAPEPWHISHKAVTEECLSQLSPTVISDALKNAPVLGQQSIHSQLEHIYLTYIINICTE